MVIERKGHTRVLDFFTENNLLSKFQSRFRGIDSTCTTVLFVTDLWLKYMDEGLITVKGLRYCRSCNPFAQTIKYYYGLQGKSLK